MTNADGNLLWRETPCDFSSRREGGNQHVSSRSDVVHEGAERDSPGVRQRGRRPREAESREGYGNAHLRERYEVWIAESRQGLGPTGRVKVQYSSMSCGVFEPSTTAPVRSSTVKSTSDAAKYTVTQSWPPSCHASLTSALAIWICSTRLVRRAPRSWSHWAWRRAYSCGGSRSVIPPLSPPGKPPRASVKDVLGPPANPTGSNLGHLRRAGPSP